MGVREQLSGKREFWVGQAPKRFLFMEYAERIPLTILRIDVVLDSINSLS